MDLRAYYGKIRETEAMLKGESFVIVSLATSEGGKAGVKTEVPRALAAKLLAEGRARLASDEEGIAFYEAHREAREAFEVDQAARRMQVVVMPQQDLRKPKERN